MSNVKLLSLCKYWDDEVLPFLSHEKKPLTLLAFANWFKPNPLWNGSVLFLLLYDFLAIIVYGKVIALMCKKKNYFIT
jgi:hypothetical protein